MGMFGKLFGGKGSRQAQLNSQEAGLGLRSGQKAKLPKKKNKKVTSAESVPGNRPSYWD